MKTFYTLIVFCICTTTVCADQIHYDFMSPGYKDSAHLECDRHVRNNQDLFLADMEALLKANKNKDWSKVHTILSRYDTKNSFINNAFAKAVYNCGNGYTFSDGGNHYRNLYSALYQYIKGIEEASKTLKRCSPSTEELHSKIKNTLALIVSATNKAANKSSNPTVLYAATLCSALYKTAG